MDGNYFIDCLLGADVRIIDAESYRSRRGEIMEELAAEYAAAGRKAYIIPEGASNGIGTFGYLACMQAVSYTHLDVYKRQLVDPPATWINATGDTVASMMVTRLVEGRDWMDRAPEEG